MLTAAVLAAAVQSRESAAAAAAAATMRTTRSSRKSGVADKGRRARRPGNDTGNTSIRLVAVLCILFFFSSLATSSSSSSSVSTTPADTDAALGETIAWNGTTDPPSFHGGDPHFDPAEFRQQLTMQADGGGYTTTTTTTTTRTTAAVFEDASPIASPENVTADETSNNNGDGNGLYDAVPDDDDGSWVEETVVRYTRPYAASADDDQGETGSGDEQQGQQGRKRGRQRKARVEEKAFTDQYVVGTGGDDGMVFATGSCALQVSEEMKTLLKQMRADMAALKSDMHAMDAALSRSRHDITRLQRAAAQHSNILDSMGAASSSSSSLTTQQGGAAPGGEVLSEAEKLKRRIDVLIEERRNLDGLCMDTRTGICPGTLRAWTFAFRTRCCFGTFY